MRGLFSPRRVIDRRSYGGRGRRCGHRPFRVKAIISVHACIGSSALGIAGKDQLLTTSAYKDLRPSIHARIVHSEHSVGEHVVGRAQVPAETGRRSPLTGPRAIVTRESSRAKHTVLGVLPRRCAYLTPIPACSGLLAFQHPYQRCAFGSASHLTTCDISVFLSPKYCSNAWTFRRRAGVGRLKRKNKPRSLHRTTSSQSSRPFSLFPHFHLASWLVRSLDRSIAQYMLGPAMKP